jgi:hypothetical protein
MKQESIEYFRDRARTEWEAVRTASCEEARSAHRQMAEAYARLVALEELKALGALQPGKVVTLSEVLRAREDAQYGRRGLTLRNSPRRAARR